MKVALDGTPLSGPTGGIQRYTSELGRALATEFGEDEYWLLSDQKLELPEGAPRNLRVAGGPTGAFRRRWWSYGVARQSGRIGADLFHGTDFAVPYLPLRPSVLTIHDLSPWKETSWGASRRVRRRTPILLKLGLATMIVTPSESVRNEVADRFGTPRSRIVAVPLAAGEVFRPVPQAPRRSPYFLYAGVLEPRKNLGRIVDAWREVRRDHQVDLVLAGRIRDDFPGLQSEPGLLIAGQIADAELAALYSGATAFLYPSLYEGFGLPVQEAMSCGAAVITSRDPALRELGGEATVQLDADDGRAWAETMRTVLTRDDWRRELRERALRRSRSYSWSNTAKRTREVYEEARRRFGR